jgi:hypothetical protein
MVELHKFLTLPLSQEMLENLAHQPIPIHFGMRMV